MEVLKTLLKFIIFLHLDQDTKTLYPVLLCSNLALKSAGVSSVSIQWVAKNGLCAQ